MNKQNKTFFKKMICFLLTNHIDLATHYVLLIDQPQKLLKMWIFNKHATRNVE
jgi:hypothetical protein